MGPFLSDPSRPVPRAAQDDSCLATANQHDDRGIARISSGIPMSYLCRIPTQWVGSDKSALMLCDSFAIHEDQTYPADKPMSS
jgi:hypothetical protein